MIDLHGRPRLLEQTDHPIVNGKSEDQIADLHDEEG